MGSNQDILKYFIGEMLGTFVLMFIGEGSTAHYCIMNAAEYEGDWLRLCAGWGLAVFFGILVSIKLSGAHLNLAVTAAMTALGKFDFKQIPVYFLGQLLGAICGTGLVHLLFYHDVAEKYIPDFSWETHKAPSVGLAQAFFNEFVLTGMLLIMILIATDEYICGKITTLKIGSIVGLTVFTIGVTFGKNTGFALNPSRDLGARIVSLITRGREAFSGDGYYFWVPIFGPITGAVIISLLYTYAIHPLMVVPAEEAVVAKEEQSEEVAA